MKIAYLIFAHNQPAHFQRLVKALDSEHVSFFIHVDQKSDIKAFQNSGFGNNVHFVESRHLVHHGGFSQVQSMMSLLAAAAAEADAQYFITLSGWDYPIKNNQQIHDFLNQNFPMNFMNFYPLVGDADLVDNIRKYNFLEYIYLAPGFLHKPLKAFKILISKLPIRRSFIPGMVPYRGSNWFCLNRKTVDYINDFLQTPQGKNYIEYFKLVLCPDEIFFQTLVLNSPYAKDCRYYDRDITHSTGIMKNENKAYLHYIDWNPKRENPTQLNLSDFDQLKNSDALFARKFNETKSKELLDAIDQKILNRG